MNSYLSFVYNGIEAYSGNAHQDGVKLAEDCIDKLGALDQEQLPPRLLILLVSPAYLDQAKASHLLLGISQTFSDRRQLHLPLVGCSTGAVFFNQRIYDEGALLICLASRRLMAEVAIGANAVREPEKAVDDLLRRLNLDWNRVDHPNPFSNHTLISFFPGYVDDDYVAPKLHKLMRQKLGARIPIFGGGACGNDPNCIKPGLLFAGAGEYNVYDDAVVVAKVRCETLAGALFTHGLTETGRLLRVSTLSQDKRAIHRFYENDAVDALEDAEHGGKVALLAEVSTEDESVIYTPKRREGEPFIRLSREVRDDACFKLMRPDARMIRISLQKSIERTIRLLHAENPIACLALKCNGLFRFRHKINLDLEGELKSIESDLNRRQNGVPPVCVGGFLDGEAGVDEHGRSVLRNWGTAALIFGDELRNPAPVYRGFEKLADLAGKRFDEPDQAIRALLEMVYEVGFQGAMISCWIHDEIEDAIIAQDAVGPRYPKVLDLTRRAVRGKDVLASVARKKRPRFVSDSRLPESDHDAQAVGESGVISQYIYPLTTLDDEVYGILQIDLGDLRYKQTLSQSETQPLDGIGAMIGSILYRTFHWKESKITRQLDQALQECLSSESGEEGLQHYLDKVLRIFGLDAGQIRLAREERNDLILIAGAGPYHEISKIPRRKFDFYDVSPTARAFREQKPVIVNHAENNPAHQQMCEHWKSVNPALHDAMKKIGSYANLPFRAESGERGTIDLVATQPWFFTWYREKALQALGERVAFLLDSLKRKSRESLILNAAPQLSPIIDLDNPDNVLRDGVTRFSEGIKAEFASLFLWDEELKTYILRAQSGWKDPNWIHAARYDKTAQWAGMISSHGAARHIYDLAGYYRERGWRESGGSYNAQIFGQSLSSTFGVETVVLPLQLAGEHLGVSILYRSIIPGQPTGFSSVDSRSLHEASEKLSGLIGLLRHRLADKRRKSESVRRDEVYKALISRSDEEEFETTICSQLIRSYQACSVDFYRAEPHSPAGLTWKQGLYLDSSQAVRSSITKAAGVWIEDSARDYAKQSANNQSLKIQCERRQLSDAQREDPALAVMEGIISRICLPLISGAQLIGVLDIKWPENYRCYSLDYDLDANEMEPLGHVIGSAYRRHRINEEKKSTEKLEEYAREISQKAKIERREVEKTKLELNQKQQDVIQSTTAYVLQNAHMLVNEASDLRGFPRRFRRIENPEEYERAIERMDKVIERIIDTANRILDPGERIANPIFERCCLKDIFNACKEQIANSLSTPAKIIIHDEVVSARIFIHADRELIQGVFINIFKNAVNAVKDVDRPCVALSVAEISDEGSVRVVIEDNGIGMPEETIRDIHTGLFSRNGRKGWGVRISKYILQGHNGLLEHKSQINKGTKAIITLPLASKE